MTSKSLSNKENIPNLPSEKQQSLSSLVEVKLDLSVVQTALTDVLSQINERVSNLEKSNNQFNNFENKIC